LIALHTLTASTGASDPLPSSASFVDKLEIQLVKKWREAGILGSESRQINLKLRYRIRSTRKLATEAGLHPRHDKFHEIIYGIWKDLCREIGRVGSVSPLESVSSTRTD
jgi:hypothetical protein